MKFKIRMFTRLRQWAESWKKKPFRYVSTALYWLRTHTYNKYHLIDCRCPHNGYSWGWFDRSEIILFANMAILKEFVEKESYQINWDGDPEHAAVKKEMDAILDWWNRGRKEEHDAYDALLTKAYGFENCMIFEPTEDPHLARMKFTREGNPEWEADCQKCQEAEEALGKKDEEMMIRLIKIRGCMWS